VVVVGDYLVGELSTKLRLVGLTHIRRVKRREEGLRAMTVIVGKSM
jgi:hypothetical protein